MPQCNSWEVLIVGLGKAHWRLSEAINDIVTHHQRGDCMGGFIPISAEVGDEAASEVCVQSQNYNADRELKQNWPFTSVHLGRLKGVGHWSEKGSS